MTRRLCAACQQKVNGWLDYYQDAGPLRRWRQLRSQMDADVRSSRLEERVQLIRTQIAMIRETCLAEHGVAA